jgi:predicted alpha/beta superfamily hydrolase
MAFAMASIVPAIAQQEFSIQSENMQGTREIVVHLPKNYDPDRSEGYPVIYMLDAGSNDAMTAEMAGYYHWGDIMPEVIVIGLKNVGRGPDFLPHYYEFENNAGEQVVGNGGKLLAYIESELIPFVDNQLNTSSDKVFAGHSWGGQFITYALSQSPGLFNAYFITSPSFGNNERWSKETFDRLKETLGQDKDFPEFIYLSAGEEEERPARLADYHRLTALLKQYLPEGVRLYHEVHNGANHTSNGAISMGKALQLYFAAKSVGE